MSQNLEGTVLLTTGICRRLARNRRSGKGQAEVNAEISGGPVPCPPFQQQPVEDRELLRRRGGVVLQVSQGKLRITIGNELITTYILTKPKLNPQVDYLPQLRVLALHPRPHPGPPKTRGRLRRRQQPEQLQRRLRVQIRRRNTTGMYE